jgi:hypothetical protein
MVSEEDLQRPERALQIGRRGEAKPGREDLDVLRRRRLEPGE